MCIYIKICILKGIVFSVVIWEVGHKESWVPKYWCFWTVVLEETLESPLDSKKIKPVNPKGNQSEIFIRRTNAEASILWPPDAKSWLIRKGPDAGKDWRQKGRQRVRWLEATPTQLTWVRASSGIGDRPGSLVCCSPWGHRARHDWVPELMHAFVCVNTETERSKPVLFPLCHAPFKLNPRELTW